MIQTMLKNLIPFRQLIEPPLSVLKNFSVFEYKEHSSKNVCGLEIVFFLAMTFTSDSPNDEELFNLPTNSKIRLIISITVATTTHKTIIESKALEIKSFR